MIHQMCTTLAERLKDRQWIEDISFKEKNFIPYIQAYPWDRTTLSHGLPGLTILYSEMDDFFPDQGWDLAAHQCIVELTHEIEEKGVHNATLFSGLTGICFAIHLASKQGARYQNLLSQLNRFLIKKIDAEYLSSIQVTREAKLPLSPFQYDVIAGISGILSYLMEALPFHPAMRETTHSLVKALVSLSEPIIYQGFQLPGWYTPKKYLIREEQRALFENGCFDTGVAHGIAGCLAALSKAYSVGVIVENQREALEGMVSWLLQHRINNEKMRHIWPGKFAFNPKEENYLEVLDDAYRDGWCYGAPGIASSFLLASKALKDEKLKCDAFEIMTAACERFSHSINLECVSICHGLAGFLAILHSMNLEVPSALLTKTITRIVNILMERYNSNLPFGYKCHVSLPERQEMRLIDNIGFLDGTIGTLLSLLFSLSHQPRRWLQLLLVR